jgi:hypothetical protein
LSDRLLVLYGTSGCHLCEQAEHLLRPWLSPSLSIEINDIAEDDMLLELYGISIPVLQREDGECLYWPFDTHTLALFLSHSLMLPQEATL